MHNSSRSSCPSSCAGVGCRSKPPDLLLHGAQATRPATSAPLQTQHRPRLGLDDLLNQRSHVDVLALDEVAQQLSVPFLGALRAKADGPCVGRGAARHFADNPNFHLELLTGQHQLGHTPKPFVHVHHLIADDKKFLTLAARHGKRGLEERLRQQLLQLRAFPRLRICGKADPECPGSIIPVALPEVLKKSKEWLIPGVRHERVDPQPLRIQENCIRHLILLASRADHTPDHFANGRLA
mmetsp:Transcript_76975/g.205710  ORF Transcript_76975/g.205710 Transcript_76975/m.205710 type:complete len:239 (-) Transcript_76975:182-898(-)